MLENQMVCVPRTEKINERNYEEELKSMYI